jgi:hypothetical protein
MRGRRYEIARVGEVRRRHEAVAAVVAWPRKDGDLAARRNLAAGELGDGGAGALHERESGRPRLDRLPVRRAHLGRGQELDGLRNGDSGLFRFVPEKGRKSGSPLCRD